MIFIQKEHKKNIKAKILLNANAKIIGHALNKIPNTNIKYMQSEVTTPGVELIYGNKTLISLPKQRTFIQIDNKEATHTFRACFEQMWKLNDN